ncbi:MAG: acetate--CoA ligase family protein [Candidatus Aenigmatarchaeota archaeon]
MNTVDEKLVKDRNSAVTIAGQIGLPVVVKAHNFINKTEHAAIKTNITTLEAVAEAFESVGAAQYSKTGKKAEGVLLQKHLDGIEFAISVFGYPDKTIRFGLGGLFTEIFNDFSSHAVPLSEKDAAAMVSGLKNSRIFDGFKGFKPIKKDRLEKVILAVAEMVQREDVKELDINPLFVNGDSALVADARIVTGDG